MATSSSDAPVIPDAAAAVSSAAVHESQMSAEAEAAPNDTQPGLHIDMRTNNGAHHAHKDGRVRNPIPSKLKGKTDMKNGNFNVMHLDITSQNESQARYDAAKRNSESTALQAKLAETDKYVSHHRRANYHRPRALRPENDVDAVANAYVSSENARIQHLTPAETKAEQARLLTLLRTLPHATVVDQICKALAFFGGIPDAPPPADGKFPESAEANGSGSLFVGWIAEIFPNLERPRRVASAAPAPTKRPRGRPKGSKATKARRDKGLKKGAKPGAQGAASSAGAVSQGDGHDEGWVDMDDSVVEDADAIERRVLDLLTTPTRGADTRAVDSTPATGSTGGFTSINPGVVDAASSSKKRGRPKGSKNRPKEAGGSQETPVSQVPPPAMQMTSVPAPAVPTVDGQSKKKNSGGRPKGSKNKAAAAAAQPAQTQVSTSYIPPPTFPSTATTAPQSTQVNGSGPNKNKQPNRTQLPAQTQVQAQAQVQVPNVQVSPAQPAALKVKESLIAGSKRKRQNKVAAGTINGDENTNANNTINITPQPPQSTTPVMNSGNMMSPQISQSSATMDSGGTSAPPAKRPRKSASVASKRQSAAAAPAPPTNMSASAASVDPEPIQHLSQQSTTVQDHTPVQGLETQYEHIATFEPRHEQNQTYTSRDHQMQQHQQATTSIGTTSSSVPSEGLDAHVENYTAALQNRQPNPSQNAASRQQPKQHQQRSTQNPSPTPSQMSKASQVTSTLTSQQPTASPNYYSHNQTPSYTIQQGSYQMNQRQQHNLTTGSPGSGLVSHVTHSTQYGTQNNNSPLMGTDNNFRSSPSMGTHTHTHTNTSFAPRRTPTASPLDSNYRPTTVTAQTSHYGAGRQTPTSTHSVANSFQSFSDPNFIDLGLDTSTGHNNMGLSTTGAYSLGGASVQRTNSSSGSASAYANAAAAMNTNYRPQNRWT